MKFEVQKLFYILILLFTFISIEASEEFIIEDIRVEGLKRITPGTVFNYLPMKVGDKFDDALSSDAVGALFKTGFFDDVKVERDGNDLILLFKERPAIGTITMTGNEDIKTDELLENLKQIGFAEGRVFLQSQLEQVEQELNRQYYSFGKYAAKITSTVTELDNNRVAITIDISEGLVAKIKKINIVGNNIFKEKELLNEFELSTPTMFSFFSKNDQYSKQKLSGDLESLRTFYLDRGYISFSLDSTQVTISPDKKNIYITINIAEGELYKISEIKLGGDLTLPENDLFELILVRSGELFSRKKLTTTTKNITDRLGEEGYSFANVNSIPDINKEEKTVSITIFVDPGKRVYVRRINFSGNIKTKDEVLRREMRQQEGAWISTAQVKRGKLRLQRTGFFKDVNVETPAVPGTPDQVDVNYTVEEAPGGQFGIGIGFSQSSGIILTTNLSQDNFLGSGNKVSFGFNNSQINSRYSIGYLNPYYTIDGISRGFNAFYKETDAFDANLSEFDSKDIGVDVIFGIPVSENNTINTSLEYKKTEINLGATASSQVRDFVTLNGSEYDIISWNVGFSFDTRNKAILPDKGILHYVRSEVVLPVGTDVEYYKLNYETKWFKDIYEDYVLTLGADIGYGDAYGDTTELPFFENFYVGGPRSVRGYKENTIGPRDTSLRPLGGSTKIVGNAEVILPFPFLKDVKQARITGFLDAGNVYGPDEDIEFDEIRYSTGLSAIWISPFGALSASYAVPFAEKSSDQLQNFQFTFGTSF
jgi:outer membrane protein insertion porin family